MCAKGMFNAEFADFRKQSMDKMISCEMVSGYLVKSSQTGEEGRKLCFLLATLLDDYLDEYEENSEIHFGPEELEIGSDNLFLPDLLVYDQNQQELPVFVLEIMANEQKIYDCLDKAVALSKSDVKEYWLIDLNGQFVYTYSFNHDFEYKRYSFDQNIKSRCFKGFECCISDLMWSDSGSLKELALFYRFKAEIEPPSYAQYVGEESGIYGVFDEGRYTAEQFYEWIETRRKKQRYTEMVELLYGEIITEELPAYRQQNIRGNLYYEVKSFIKANQLPFQLYFMPVSVELKKVDILDSVVMPDLFMIGKDEAVLDNMYHGVPIWIVEIASPATAAQDYIDKAQLYRYHGVQEYWVVNEWKKQILVLKYDVDDQEVEEDHIYGFDEKIPVGVIEGLEIKMSDLIE